MKNIKLKGVGVGGETNKKKTTHHYILICRRSLFPSFILLRHHTDMFCVYFVRAYNALLHLTVSSLFFASSCRVVREHEAPNTFSSSWGSFTTPAVPQRRPNSRRWGYFQSRPLSDCWFLLLLRSWGLCMMWLCWGSDELKFCASTWLLLLYSCL